MVLSAALVAVPMGCRSGDRLPKLSSPAYTQFTDAFYTGLAGLQVGDDVRAEGGLAEATRLAPGEPAAWADWGVLALRQRSFDSAASRLARAAQLAPGNAQIAFLTGQLESERGDSAKAVQALERAVQLNPRNTRALYALAAEVERGGAPGSDARYEQLLQQILTLEPGNTAALVDLCRVAAKRGEAATLRTAVARIAAQGGGWPADVQAQVKQLQAAANGPAPRAAAMRSVFLRNVLMQVPAFRTDLADLMAAPGAGAEPLLHLLRLPNAPSEAAPADTGLHFQVAQADASQPWSWTGAVYLNGADAPVLAEANGHSLRLSNGTMLPFPGGPHAVAPGAAGVLPVDLNFDFKTELVEAGAGGVVLLQQADPTHFIDVTGKSKLPASVLHGDYTGAWALDVEADGDLDVLLGAAHAAPVLLRNNGDGTFTAEHLFGSVTGLQAMQWLDLNGDGNPDAVLLDEAGRVHVFLNRRSGEFREVPVETGGPVRAIAAGDTGGGGPLSLLALRADGAIVRLVSPDEDGSRWSGQQIAAVPATLVAGTGAVHLLAADLDNNGAVDLLVSSASAGGTTSVLLADGHGGFAPLGGAPVPLESFDTADLAGKGQLALVGLRAANQGAPAAESAPAAETATAAGTKHYHWQMIRPRARQATGDQRVNSFGIGGEVELRAGLLVQRQPITRPALHFGLGEAKEANVARILWPNGTVRAEFALKADKEIVTEQRLKGSCPFLFAWNGQRMAFVKDSVPWGSAIGLRINALGSASIAATEEWYKIRGDQLQSRGGNYDLRVTGELWETYFYDMLALMTVDHPRGTEIYTDERFDVPAVKLSITETREPQPVVHAVDDNGDDVTATVSKLDGVYLDNFGRGQYQGVTRDHYVEVTLPDALPAGPVWLIAKGWLHPSDSSINIALSQGSSPKPAWLSMEVPDGHGGWRVARPNLGFPAGRNKTCLFDLAGLWAPGLPHRLRLRTNLEVYWDQIQWAEGVTDPVMRVERLQPNYADLHYRGYSRITQANASSPEIPHYEQIAGTAQRWRDLEGYYTRFGDVRPLLASTDDRYVIMNAGDELALRFAAPATPPAGWTRDFVLAGDGWIKDGDYNSTESRTVAPYPYHARRDYDSAPGPLADDWEYRHHWQDWQTYQTRYITAAPFEHALEPGTGQNSKAGQ